ncbi:pro-sigmaK processing inhibitor BofA family protein [Halobaculum sp. MBLA0147]|uniref:pro-sigmaK processing inhibitor BofA family protein n=1 Tax=Halobaculum sp. MBLA0147 TaxID=3079934 RepID=UPI0035248DD8
MVTPLELGVVAVALVALVVAYRLLKAAKTLAINAILGVVVLIVANLLGAGVELSLVAVAVCALAGVPGAILVILLSLLDVAFVAATLPLV